jgi:hypothetical protein
VTLLVAMLLWLAIRPALDWGTSSLAQVLIRAFEYPRVTRLVVDDHRAVVQRSDFRSDSKIPTVSLTETHFNTIVLLTLYLALPKPWSRKQLELLFMGWCILYVTQTLNLYLHVKCIYAFSLGEWSIANYSRVAQNFYGFFRYFTDLPGRFGFPFVIWLTFNWESLTSFLGIREEERKAKTPKRKKSKRRKQ